MASILSPGQFSGDNEGKDSREFKEIKKHTGKTPAILGLDVLNLFKQRTCTWCRRRRYDAFAGYGLVQQ